MVRRHLCSLLVFIVLVCDCSAQRLVMPGDYPDPSVVKIGNTFWASATTSNWMPAYPLLKSSDLVHWKTVGSVFNTKPSWADFYFWAPEISYDKGKVYIYYAAHKKGGNLCVGIASADKPEGPYKDHGPLICQTVGSIDAFPMRDENGKLHLIWKEDANSVGKPTPIWIQELNEGRTALIGERQELFRNNQPWEGNLVEGVSMIRHQDWFYTFYAAAGCCGSGCNYTTGVARSKNLQGPWEKYAANPVLKDEGSWKCPGHGTPIEKDGRFYFLHHAYDTAGGVYTGRQGLLQEFRFTPDGWIQFVKEQAASISLSETEVNEFDKRSLADEWQWSVFQTVNKKIKNSETELNALTAPTGAFLGKKTYTLNYDATMKVNRKLSSAATGIGLLGDERNTISALIKGSKITVVQVKNNKDSALLTKTIPLTTTLYLRMQVRNGKDIMFLYSNDGKSFSVLNKQSINGAFLPPWDRALRAGVVAKGTTSQKGVFADFKIKNLKSQ